MLQEAEGYRAQVVNAAQGEASRFTAVQQEYVKAPEVTRERLYLETMESVLGNVQMFLLDTPSGSAQGIVPYLPLNELKPPPPAPAPTDGETNDAPPSRPASRSSSPLGFLLLNSIYIVDERQKAMVLQFGQVRAVKEEPGLAFKIPFIQNVVYYDSRIQGLDTNALEVTPLDDRRLIVDAFARWRIADVSSSAAPSASAA